jgi:MipA family protein
LNALHSPDPDFAATLFRPVRLRTRATIRILFAATAAIFGAPAAAQPGAAELNQLYAETPPGPPERQPPDWRGFIGAGFMSASRAVGDTRTSVTPMVSITYKETVYWHAAQGGVWLLQSEDRHARLGILTRLRRGYDPDAVENLAGMDRRDTSIEAGINGSWTVDRSGFAIALTKDVTDRSNGRTATAAVTQAVHTTDRSITAMSVSVEWLDAKFVDYYYGVEPAEATALRPTYEGRNTVNLRIGATERFLITRNTSLIGSVGYTRYGSGVADSPIVTKDGAFSFLIGGGWRF